MCDFFDQTGMEPDGAVADPFGRLTLSRARAWMIRARDIGRSGLGILTNPDRTFG